MWLVRSMEMPKSQSYYTQGKFRHLLSFQSISFKYMITLYCTEIPAQLMDVIDLFWSWIRFIGCRKLLDPGHISWRSCKRHSQGNGCCGAELCSVLGSVTETLYKLLKPDFSKAATSDVSLFQTACLRAGCFIYENIVDIADYISAVSCEMRNSQQLFSSQRAAEKNKLIFGCDVLG